MPEVELNGISDRDDTQYRQDDSRSEAFSQASWIRSSPSSTSTQSRPPRASTYFRNVSTWARSMSPCSMRDTLFWLTCNRPASSTCVSS